MDVAWNRGNSRWAVAGVGAFVLVVLLALLFRLPAPPPPISVSQRGPDVSVAQAGITNRILSEQTLLRDNAPLFLPTEWNVTLPPPKAREPGRAFLEIEPRRLSLSESAVNVAKELPVLVTLNGKPLAEAKPVDAVLAGTPPPLTGFGRVPSAIMPFAPRGGVIEVVAAGSGERVLVATVPATAAAPTAKPWQPIEFLLAVDRMGLVGPLQFISRSGVEEADNHFRNYLAQSYRIGERLRPGFYRVVVTP
jgi:hypothetical protein